MKHAKSWLKIPQKKFLKTPEEIFTAKKNMLFTFEQHAKLYVLIHWNNLAVTMNHNFLSISLLYHKDVAYQHRT